MTEIEEESAFYLQIKDRAMAPAAVQSILSSFGELLAFRGFRDDEVSRIR